MYRDSVVSLTIWCVHKINLVSAVHIDSKIIATDDDICMTSQRWVRRTSLKSS